MPSAEELAQVTLALCRIDSPIGHEQALADHLERWAVPLFGRAQVLRSGHSLVLGDLADPRPAIGLIGQASAEGADAHAATAGPTVRRNASRFAAGWPTDSG